MEEMQDIRRLLIESGVIGRVLQDFNPRLKIILFYGDTRISIGDEVTLDEVQHCLTDCKIYYNPRDVDILEAFRDPELVACIITDPDAPGGEYLHWLSVGFFSTDNQITISGLPRIDVVAYEPPRAGARMLVFTLFLINEYHRIVPPNSRENFSTRFFHNDARWWPLGASFFKLR